MAGVDGTWKLTVNSPMGAQDIDLTLASSGSTLTGSMSGAMGTTEISNGSVDGDSFTFDAAITQPFPLTITVAGEVAGDRHVLHAFEVAPGAGEGHGPILAGDRAGMWPSRRKSPLSRRSARLLC